MNTELKVQSSIYLLIILYIKINLIQYIFLKIVYIKLNIGFQKFSIQIVYKTQLIWYTNSENLIFNLIYNILKNVYLIQHQILNLVYKIYIIMHLIQYIYFLYQIMKI